MVLWLARPQLSGAIQYNEASEQEVSRSYCLLAVGLGSHYSAQQLEELKFKPPKLPEKPVTNWVTTSSTSLF